MGQAIQVRRSSTLSCSLGSVRATTPRPHSVSLALAMTCGTSGRDVEEIPRTHVDPRLQFLTEPQHPPSLQDVDGGFMSSVAMGLCSPAGRDR
jgi:hypothetical protein